MPRGRRTRDEIIVRRQEALALRLLDRALEAVGANEVGVDVQLDVFEKVGKWVSIKNRLVDMEETDIDRFKQRIHGTEAPVAKGRGVKAVSDPDKLAGIKERLSGRGGGSSHGNSGDSGGSVPPDAGG